MSSALLELIAEKYPLVAKDLLNPLLEHMRLSRNLCGSDAEQALVLFVIGMRTAEHEDYRNLTIEDLRSGRLGVLPSLKTNARSIAESLGMPRESVRRRVRQLIEEGLVDREGNDLRLSAKGLAQLAPARESAIALAARYFQIVSLLVIDPAYDSAPCPLGASVRSVAGLKAPACAADQ